MNSRDLLNKLSLNDTIGKAQAQEVMPQPPLMPLEEAVSRLVETGVLSPRQGYDLLFHGTKPTEFKGEQATKPVRLPYQRAAEMPTDRIGG